MPRLREPYLTCRIVDTVDAVFSANRPKAVNVLDPTASVLLHNSSSSSPPKPNKEVPSIYLPTLQFSICRRYLSANRQKRSRRNNLPMPSFFPPARLASKKRKEGIRYLLFLIKQTEKQSNIQVPLPPTVPVYLLPPNPRGPTYLVSHSFKQGHGAWAEVGEACTVRML